MEPKIIFAKDKNTSKIVRIENADNGKSCNCICLELECGMDLQAIQGKDRKWHFRHSVVTNCQGGFETAIHYAAKQILEESDFVILHDGSIFNYEKTITEKYVSNFKPDIQLLSDIETILIEIKVENGITEEKLLKIKEYNKKVIEIDLSDVNRDVTFEELRELVLNDVSKKHLIYAPYTHPELVPVQKQNDSVPQILKIAFLVFVAVIIFNFLFPKKKYSVR